jgi:hypothetical protein
MWSARRPNYNATASLVEQTKHSNSTDPAEDNVLPIQPLAFVTSQKELAAVGIFS